MALVAIRRYFFRWRTRKTAKSPLPMHSDPFNRETVNKSDALTTTTDMWSSTDLASLIETSWVEWSLSTDYVVAFAHIKHDTHSSPFFLQHLFFKHYEKLFLFSCGEWQVCPLKFCTFLITFLTMRWPNPPESSGPTQIKWRACPTCSSFVRHFSVTDVRYVFSVVEIRRPYVLIGAHNSDMGPDWQRPTGWCLQSTMV